jgi:integrase
MDKPHKIALVWYAKTPDRGWRHFTAILEKHPEGGTRAKHGWVMDGKPKQPTHYPLGKYYLRHREGRGADARIVYTPLGDNINSATAVDKLYLARRAALRSPDHTKSDRVLKIAAQNYIDKCETDGKMEAYRNAKLVMGEFLSICKVTYVRTVKPEDVTRYLASLRKRGNSARTVRNKHDRLMWFLRYAKGDPETIAAMKKDRPTFTKREPDTYNSAQLSAILNAADEYMRLVLLLGSQCGLREQEIAHAAWEWVKWENSTLHIKDSPDHGWQIKDKEERICPVPSAVLSALKAWRETHPKARLIVGTDSDRPNTHLLRTLKRLADRAGLNCGQCGCEESGECREWTLHRLRRTAATRLLKKHDIATVAQWFGWSDLETAKRYLQASDAGSPETRVSVDSAFADL